MQQTFLQRLNTETQDLVREIEAFDGDAFFEFVVEQAISVVKLRLQGSSNR